MDYRRDLNNSRNNQIYYTQLKKDNAARRKRKKSSSFGSQKFQVEDIVWAPDGYEGVFLFLYFISVPYIVGSLFLFFAVASGDLESFLKLNTAAFFIVWAIGYEIVASIVLFWIFILFLRYNDDEEYG